MQALQAKVRTAKPGRGLVCLTLAAFLLRALVPAGMMAAPVAEGWLFQLCPSGMATSSYLALVGQEPQPHSPNHAAGHHQTVDHSTHSAHVESGSETDPACGLNAGFYALSFGGNAPLTGSDVSKIILSQRPTEVLARAPPRANQTRAPPEYS